MSATIRALSLFFVLFWLWAISQASGFRPESAFLAHRSVRPASGHRSGRKARSSPSMDVDSRPKTKQGNQKVRKIMNLIISNCNSIDGRFTSPAEWTKTRNYVYRAKDALTTTQVSEVVSFLNSLFPSEVVCTVLQSSPRILRKDVNGSLKPTAEFLQQLYTPALFQEAISRNPALLLTSGVVGGGENKKLEAFLQNDLELSKSTIDKLKKTLLFQLPLAKVRSMVKFLEGIMRRGGFSINQSHQILGKILVSHTYLANLSVKENLRPRIAFLKESCDLDESDVASLVKSSPGILGLSVELNLKPTLSYLSSIVSDPFNPECDEKEQRKLLRRCLMGHPQLLALSMKNLETKVAYFNSIDRLVPRLDDRSSLAAKIALRAPAVFSLSLRDNIIPTVEFLAIVWGCQSPQVQFDGGEIVLADGSVEEDKNADLAKRLKDYPNVLTLSLEGNIQPTISFFNRTGYIYLDEDWKKCNDTEALSHNIPGRYIAASLFSRLLPRWHHVASKEWQPPSGALNKLPPLHVLVGATDRDFCKKMGFDFDDYIEFKSENAPRLKFSSQFDTWLKCGRPIDVS